MVAVTFIRTFILGTISSGIFQYLLLFLVTFCIMALVAWIQAGEKSNYDISLLLFYFVFSVIFCLCLMSISKPLLGIDLYSSYQEVQTRFSSVLSSLGIHFHISLPKDILAAALALFIGSFPPLLMSSSFRYAKLQLDSHFGIHKPLSFLSFHLLLFVIYMSIPKISIDKLEGKVLFGLQYNLVLIVIVEFRGNRGSLCKHV